MLKARKGWMAILALGVLIGCGVKQSELAVIYGNDDRLEMEDAGLSWSVIGASVGLIIDRKVSKSINSTQVRVPSASLASAPFCKNSKYKGQRAMGVCTGFLVQRDIFVTAGHCVLDQHDCESLSITFDHISGNYKSKGNNLIVPEVDLFNCQDLLARRFEHRGVDLAVLKLDRPRREWIDVEDVRAVSRASKITLISHPFGLPKKFSSNGKVREVPANEPRFLAELNLARVGSGSPVFGSFSKQVVGMALRGHKDLRRTDEGCYEEVRCLSGECRGEDILHVDEISSLLAKTFD